MNHTDSGEGRQNSTTLDQELPYRMSTHILNARLTGFVRQKSGRL